MKNPIQSKTLWLNLLVALATLVLPALQDWIAQHPIVAGDGFALANAILRWFTYQRLSVRDAGDSMTVKITK